MPIVLKKMKRQGQRGMTLIIGLILLLMLTVIGLIGFRNTTLSERMTGNAVDRNASFQSSESAGKEALQAIESGSFNAGVTTGHYGAGFANGGGTVFWTQWDGTTTACTPAVATFSWANCSASVTSKYATGDPVNNVQIKDKAQYAIELLATDTTSTAGSTIYTYRVTSRSTGGSGDAEVVLQTIYTRTTTP